MLLHPVNVLGPPIAIKIKTAALNMPIVQPEPGSSSQITLSYVKLSSKADKDSMLTPPLKDLSLEITPLLLF